MHQFDEDVVLKVGEFYPLNYTTKTLSEVNGSQDGFDHGCGIFYRVCYKSKRPSIGTLALPMRSQEESRRWPQLLMNKESGVSHYSGEIIEHCILTAGWTSAPRWRTSTQIRTWSSAAEALVAAQL